MPKVALRADARTMPKANPDAQLIALANECAAIGADVDAKSSAADAAERNTRKAPTPQAVLRTEDDMQNGFFVGRSGIGQPYSREDIELLRPLVRRMARDTTATPGSQKAYLRACEILEQWGPWNAAIAAEEARTGYAPAQAAQFSAMDRYDAAAWQVSIAPATTLEGILAKARAFRRLFGDDEGLADKIVGDLKSIGPDADVFALSLARDVLQLAGEA